MNLKAIGNAMLQKDDFCGHSGKIAKRRILFYLVRIHRLNLMWTVPLGVFGNRNRLIVKQVEYGIFPVHIGNRIKFILR